MSTGEVDIGTIPSTLPTITQLNMLYCFIYLVLLVMLMIFFMKIKEVIVGVMVQGVQVGICCYRWNYIYVELIENQ